MSAERWDAIYLSPHLDDAALSCGGQIAARTRRGERVLVLTLFTADEPPPPYSRLASSLHEVFGVEGDVVARRRHEDEEACRLLGATKRHAGLPEAIYRCDAAGDPLYDSFTALFAAPVPADRPILEALGERLAALPATASTFAPLGVGGHVDHRLTRSAAELTGHDLTYYEEIPYVEKWLALRRALGRRRDWRPRTVAFDAADLDAKIAACKAYASQIAGLYRNERRLEKALRRRARKLGGERLWTRAQG